MFGLARSGVKVPANYYETYYKNVTAAVTEAGGRLSETKYTEYSRLVLALTAIGRDPRDVGGYDLLMPLADFDRTPLCRRRAMDMWQNEDGGWSLAGGASDVDLTAMALQALAKYRGDAAVSGAVERGLSWLEWAQEPNGAYLSWDEGNSESVCQVIVALTELGISLDDERFVKNGQTLPQVLERFACEDGSYRHSVNGSSDEMATEQALYALAAIHRAEAGEATLYDITDVIQ